MHVHVVTKGRIIYIFLAKPTVVSSISTHSKHVVSLKATSSRANVWNQTKETTPSPSTYTGIEYSSMSSSYQRKEPNLIKTAMVVLCIIASVLLLVHFILCIHHKYKANCASSWSLIQLLLMFFAVKLQCI